METLQIQFEPKNRTKVIEMLHSFPKNGVKIIHEDPHFDENKKILHLSYEKLVSGKSKIYDIDELEEMLDKTISEYES